MANQCFDMNVKVNMGKCSNLVDTPNRQKYWDTLSSGFALGTILTLKSNLIASSHQDILYTMLS